MRKRMPCVGSQSRTVTPYINTDRDVHLCVVCFVVIKTMCIFVHTERKGKRDKPKDTDSVHTANACQKYG